MKKKLRRLLCYLLAAHEHDNTLTVRGSTYTSRCKHCGIRLIKHGDDWYAMELLEALKVIRDTCENCDNCSECPMRTKINNCTLSVATPNEWEFVDEQPNTAPRLFT